MEGELFSLFPSMAFRKDQVVLWPLVGFKFEINDDHACFFENKIFFFFTASVFFQVCDLFACGEWRTPPFYFRLSSIVYCCTAVCVPPRATGFFWGSGVWARHIEELIARRNEGVNE